MLKYLAPLFCLAALAIPAAAMADDPPTSTDSDPAPTLLPTPPPPGPVVDEAGAGVFARAFLIANAGQLVPGARAVDVDLAACRQVDGAPRFYCLLRARLVRIQRQIVTRFVVIRSRKADDGPGNHNRHNRPHRRPIRVIRIRVQPFVCVAVVRILGGPGVTPTGSLPVRDCVAVRRAPA